MAVGTTLEITRSALIAFQTRDAGQYGNTRADGRSRHTFAQGRHHTGGIDATDVRWLDAALWLIPGADRAVAARCG